MFPSLGKSTKFESVVAFCTPQTNPEVFCVREKLFRVGIRKEEEEFYSDQIYVTSDQSFRAVHPAAENHIQKKNYQQYPTRGHIRASSGEDISTGKGLERSGEIGRQGAAGSMQSYRPTSFLCK
jgi:hypothetical protein